jgi:hypothetical protein
MSKATITLEDDGDEVKIHIDFGPDGGQETSGAHQMALMAVQSLAQQAGGSMEQGEQG